MHAEHEKKSHFVRHRRGAADYFKTTRPREELPRPFAFSRRLLLFLWVWKAHGTAAGQLNSVPVELRIAKLLQTTGTEFNWPAVAVLEQPSPRWMPDSSLGRRNIALSQSDELNASQERSEAYPAS